MHYHCIYKMRERKFVEQNKDKWAQFEQDLRSNKKDPKLLRAQLLQISDDLSYARTFYRNRSVRIYLNGLGQQIYSQIYRNKMNIAGSLGTFFKDEIPRIAYFCRKEMLIAFLVLLLSVGIGVFSSARDEGFARSVLGDGYVEMTLENIRSGNPLGVYQHQDQTSMFFSIAGNNLRVALMVFLSGLLASYGAMVIMARNGIMLGVFMYFFYSRNLASEFNLTVWMHGTIEILTLVVETAAGMLLGRGLVYPGTLSRAKAFSIWGKRGAMLFLSTVPFIVFAAFIESFLTRYTGMPDLLRGLLIVLSLLLMLVYFVWYPLLRFRHAEDADPGMPELSPETGIEFQSDAIYSNGQIFLKAIKACGLKFQLLLRGLILISLVYLGLILLFARSNVHAQFTLLELGMEDLVYRPASAATGKFATLFSNAGLLFNRSGTVAMFALSSLWLSALILFALYLFNQILPRPGFRMGKAFLFILPFLSAFNLLLFMRGWYSLLYILLSPLFIVVMVQLIYGYKIRQILQRIPDMLAGAYSRMAGLLFVYLISGLMGLVFIVSPASYLAVWLMEINVPLSAEAYTSVLQGIMLFAFILLTGFSTLFYVLQSVFLTFTLREITGAEGLNARIEQMGNTKKAYGIETE